MQSWNPVLLLTGVSPGPASLEDRLVAYVKMLDTHTGFPGGAVVKNPPANAGDTGSSPGPGRSHMPRSN